MKSLRLLLMGAAFATASLAQSAYSQELVIWHDLGDNGIKWFEEAGAEFAKENPGVTITSISYPTDQWFGRVISAINTNTAPDLIYNNYERVIRIETQTDFLMDLTDTLSGMDTSSFLTDADMSVAKYNDKTIILPTQRVQMGFGVRKSWLEKVGESFPQTWDDVKRIAVKFKNDDPDANGKDDTFGLALEAAKPRDLIHMLDLYTFGAGLRHTLIDPEGKIVIDEPKHAAVLKEFMKTFTDYGFVAPDTINHSFGEMYQVIEGGRAGMFRVGDWNVKKWDAQALNGDFELGNWPAHFDDETNAVVIGGMRGVAVPDNSPNKELAVKFAQFLLSKPAQQAALENVGAAVRKDLDIADLSERRQYFAAAKGNLNAYDFPESVLPYYPELEASFHRALLSAISNPPADWDAFIKDLAKEMREKTALLKN
ncbi:extracellular solute-binding protein [uncultured Cohaesibacter sp.]|uniref:ABC transporter substrate-binding protein n=1 Tax=uncultured Cohaesibacter sp. TaxID=1002546 RepID=UPI0029C94F23|nr:extracellular solute-binding protein [uncultured Cohaesibacter sp.]